MVYNREQKREYYENNKEEIKEKKREYYRNNRERIIKRNIEWAKINPKNYYENNKIEYIKKVIKYQKETNYAAQKTPLARKMRYIKRETRRLFPLYKKICEFCYNPATEHHHNTSPIEVDKFNYVCHSCHKILHNKLLIICKEGKIK